MPKYDEFDLDVQTTKMEGDTTICVATQDTRCGLTIGCYPTNTIDVCIY